MAFQEALIWGSFGSITNDERLLVFAELLSACPAETVSWLLLRAAGREDEAHVVQSRMHGVVNQARELRLLPGTAERRRLLQQLNGFTQEEKRHFIDHTSHHWREECNSDPELRLESVQWN